MNNIYGNGELIKTAPKVDNRIEGQESIDLLSQKRLMDMWAQKYFKTVTRSAREVFMFIWARTCTFNKVKEIISIRDISEGIYSKDGDLIIEGLGLCESAVKAAIHDLIDKDYIIKTHRIDSNNYKQPSIFEINIQFFNKEIEKMHNKKPAEKPKSKNKGLQKVAQKKHIKEALPQGFLPNDEGLETEEILGHENDPIGLSNRTSLTINISKDILRSETKRNLLQPNGCYDVTRDIFIKEYIQKMKDNYGRYFISPSVGTKHYSKLKGQLNHLYKKLTEVKDLDLLDFINYCITEWKFVCTNRLHFLERYHKSELPVSPEIGIILKFTDKFIDAYNREIRKDPEMLEAVFGDSVAFRARELQKMGYTSTYAQKRALEEQEIATALMREHELALEKAKQKYEYELALMRVEQDKQLTLARNEMQVLQEKLDEAEFPEIFNFTLNDKHSEDYPGQL